MLKIYINNEEVVANNDFTINKHMLNTPSVILNNVCPKSWKENKDYSSFYHPQDFSKCKIQDETYIPAEPGTFITITNSGTVQNVDTTKLQDFLQLDGLTSQSGTPTPSSPQPINVVSGRQLVSISNGDETKNYEINLGKNMFPTKTFTSTSSERLVSEATSGQTVYGIPVEAGQTYTASFDITALPSADYRIQFINSANASVSQGTADPPRIERQQITCNQLQRYSVSITTTQAGYLYLRCVPVGFTLDNIQLEKGQATSYSEYKTPIELCKIGNYTDHIFKAINGDSVYDNLSSAIKETLTYGGWYIEKQTGKVVLTGAASENWAKGSAGGYTRYVLSLSNGKGGNDRNEIVSDYFRYSSSNEQGVGFEYRSALYLYPINIESIDDWKTWLSTHRTTVYYILNTPSYTEIEDNELLNQLDAVKLISGLNNVSISSPYLATPISFHYNYKNEETTVDLLFCGVVKNSGKISLNPREPHLTTLQILDFKDFLSSGELDGFVIYQKTILEAIQMVIGNIQDYGFILGNVNILNPNDIIGAYSTKDKTAYDVFNYLADISQSRWTTRLIDENTVAIDFYDPTLMIEGNAINYTQSYFENNLIDNMSYNYGSNNYRNKQVMTSSQVYSNISQAQTIIANGYQTQFPTEQPIGKINSITVNSLPATYATFNEKDMGYIADFYYTPGENYIESDNTLTVGQTIVIDYISIVEGRQIITNPLEIDRIEESTGRKGIISRYETRNDATTSTELQKIGESYIKYKGTPEITLTIDSRKNLWEVGQRVQFNAPIDELETEYMVRTKKINYIVSTNTLFYTYELVSSFNSETEINYFDNQRAKSKGNIGEGEYISRNIDIESTANIIFYDTETTEVEVSGDNALNSILNSPFIS